MNAIGQEAAASAPRWRGWRRAVLVSLVTAALLVASVAVPYAYFRAGLYTKSSDESARTIEAWFWTFDKSAVKIDAWLQLPMLLTGLVLEAWPDLFLAPRALTMALGALLLPALAWLAHELFRQRGAPLLTMALAAFFGPRIVLGTVPLSEILYMVLLTLGLAAAARWMRLNRLRWLPLAALGIGLASGVRYEGWLFAVILAAFAMVYLHFDRSTTKAQRLGALVCAVVVLGIVPAFWCSLWYRLHGDPMGFLGIAGERYFRVANPDHSFPLLWEHGLIYQFWRQNLVSLNLLGAVGCVLFTLRRPRVAWWLVLPTSAFIVLGALALAGRALPTHNFWRVAAPFSVLLLPFTAHAVLACACRLGSLRRPLQAGSIAVATAVLLIAFHFQCFKMAEVSEMDEADVEAGRFVREHLHASTGSGRPRVFIEDIGLRTAHVKVASNDPGAFLPEAQVLSLVKNGVLDLETIRTQNIAVMVIRAEWADKVQARLEVFRAAEANGRWLLLALDPE